ncbi:MAG TPA: GNAT family N-acetyltransferase [Mycobacteriales bacterium]|jgi:RimJ/RimL family protein N-acetyltransferase|nr:GNAT family N-acetyltransferase [Mycobacteriales bacterium]
MSQQWPLFDIRVRTPRLELRLPSTEQLEELAELSIDGVHGPELMPFVVPWTDTPPTERGREVMKYHWRSLGSWTPAEWDLNFVVLHDGVVIGTQGISGRHFGVLREFTTGSWLGRRYHGNGYGTEMRAAVLHLGFAGLDAEYATSGAFADNAPSLNVSRKLGYEQDGIQRLVRRGAAATEIRLRMSRAAWAANHKLDVEIQSLENSLPLFGSTQDSG